MIYDFKYLRPFSPAYPPYPPYANPEMYMETYFWNYFRRNLRHFGQIDRQYLPVFWTTIYNDHLQVDVQQYLDALPREGKYFTIIQHDDGVHYRLPKDTIVFSASENGNGHIIPIPLIASPIPVENVVPSKDILCSFVGSMTHPIRQQLFDTLSPLENFKFKHFMPWSPRISEDRLKDFIDITQRSKFALAPRGNIMQSFRLYEILQLGTVPVIVSDTIHLPFPDVVGWNDISIVCAPQGIPLIQDRLANMPDDEYQSFLKKGKEAYDKYFTLEGMCARIADLLY